MHENFSFQHAFHRCSKEAAYLRSFPQYTALSFKGSLSASGWIVGGKNRRSSLSAISLSRRIAFLGRQRHGIKITGGVDHRKNSPPQSSKFIQSSQQTKFHFQLVQDTEFHFTLNQDIITLNGPGRISWFFRIPMSSDGGNRQCQDEADEIDEP
jgi:hypothetical protein